MALINYFGLIMKRCVTKPRFAVAQYDFWKCHFALQGLGSSADFFAGKAIKCV